jgi:hypothetical protein
MDAAFTQAPTFGNWHRLVDGSHSFVGSLNAVKAALPDASPLRQVIEWLSAYWNDLVTPCGMPFVTCDREFDFRQLGRTYLTSGNPWGEGPRKVATAFRARVTAVKSGGKLRCSGGPDNGWTRWQRSHAGQCLGPW